MIKLFLLLLAGAAAQTTGPKFTQEQIKEHTTTCMSRLTNASFCIEGSRAQTYCEKMANISDEVRVPDLEMKAKCVAEFVKVEGMPRGNCIGSATPDTPWEKSCLEQLKKNRTASSKAISTKSRDADATK